VALELELTAPGEWTLKRDSVELGTVHCTRQNALFSLIDPKNPLTENEKEELAKLVRLMVETTGA
jgi:hypothetical protein